MRTFADRNETKIRSIPVASSPTPPTETGPGSVTATPVTLNGDDQTTTYSLALTVTDNRTGGKDVAWHLTIISTRFNDGHGDQLPSNASSIRAAPIVTCVTTTNGQSCTSPTNTFSSYPVTVPTANPANEFYGVNGGTSHETLTITPIITVWIPANTTLGSSGAATFSSTASV